MKELFRMQTLFLVALLAAFLVSSTDLSAAVATTHSVEFQLDGGKEKKRKATSKPSKRARQSAKDARKAMKLKESQVQGRARVRLFFHNMFNTKYGKPVNFRSKRQRRRWKKGRMG
jgi:hypothetical protein